MSWSTLETVATFTGDDEEKYEIDHLGITSPLQWGTFTVHRKGKQVELFTIPDLPKMPRHSPKDLPMSVDDLVAEAVAAMKTRQTNAAQR